MALSVAGEGGYFGRCIQYFLTLRPGSEGSVNMLDTIVNYGIFEGRSGLNFNQPCLQMRCAIVKFEGVAT